MYLTRCNKNNNLGNYFTSKLSYLNLNNGLEYRFPFLHFVAQTHSDGLDVMASFQMFANIFSFLKNPPGSSFPDDFQEPYVLKIKTKQQLCVHVIRLVKYLKIHTHTHTHSQ